MRNHRFSTGFLYIVCGRRAAQHARCHKEYDYPRGKPSLRVTSTCARSADFASASDFTILKCLSGLEIDNFHGISASEHPTGASMQTLSALKVFPLPLYRAGVLHAPNYDLNDKRKIRLTKTNWFFHEKS